MDGNARVVEFIREFRWEDAPAEVKKQAKICLLDLAGNCLAGSETKGGAIVLEFARRQLGRAPEATVIRAEEKLSCTAACLVNGFIANALDMDDGYREIKGHPGAAVFPAVLAFSEMVGASGKELLEALVIGYEIGIRAGTILHSHYGYYHGSGSWGAMGAAASGARLLGLSEKQVQWALGIAEAHAPLTPVMRSVEFPAMAPKDGIAWGAMAGAGAALLAQGGFTGSPSLFDDKKRNRDVLTLGEQFRILGVYFKRYPCCRWAHPAIDAVLDIRRQKGLEASNIRRITVRTFNEAISLSGAPPADLEHAEYNVRFPVAVSALFGDFGPNRLTQDCFSDPEIRNLMEKIHLVPDPEIQKNFPGKCLSSVEIITEGGAIHSSGLRQARGDRDFPLSEKEMEEKYTRITAPVLGEKKTAELLALIGNFEEKSVGNLIAYIA